MNHWVIHINNNSAKKHFITEFLKGNVPKELQVYSDKSGGLFSQIALEKLILEEDRHDHRLISPTSQSLEILSSGEQKKALLGYLLGTNPDYLILDNLFDNLDADFQEELKLILRAHLDKIGFIQLASRKMDALPFITNHALLEGQELKEVKGFNTAESKSATHFSTLRIPPPLKKLPSPDNPLVKFKKVSVSYGVKPIVNEIDWTINKGDFWQLTGANGSGKTTLLSMITGDNPKAFNQEIYLFGVKKGSGESVWDIKEKIGYYSPAMTLKFKGRHTVEHMLISGLTDSVGLYTLPTESQKRHSRQWLILLDLYESKDVYFNTLSMGKQRLVMTARAMVKHPPLLILDEPTADMDDASAALLVSLVNKIAKETNTAVLFVSHRKEPGLRPHMVYTLKKTKLGSIGVSSKP